MSDEKIQAWLNGEGTEKPDSADLNLYQRLYASLAMEPEDRLPGTFSGQVADRVGLRNSHYSPDRVLVILIAIVMGFSSVAAVAVAVTSCAHGTRHGSDATQISAAFAVGYLVIHRDGGFVAGGAGSVIVAFQNHFPLISESVAG